MNFDTFLHSVSKIENIELPGESSHLKMSPPYRLELMERNKELMKKARKAGVLALFYPSIEHQTQLALILRKTYKGVHSAQIGFPGGKIEEGDIDIKFTALREAQEEIGVPKCDVQVLKALTELYIPPSNFTVYPFFGVSPKTPRFVKQEDEVDDVIEVSLSHFIDDVNMIKTIVPTSYKLDVEVPAFQLNGHIVWGATAMMLSELKDLIKQVL